jgi:hypothetical protein
MSFAQISIVLASFEYVYEQNACDGNDFFFDTVFLKNSTSEAMFLLFALFIKIGDRFLNVLRPGAAGALIFIHSRGRGTLHLYGEAP